MKAPRCLRSALNLHIGNRTQVGLVVPELTPMWALYNQAWGPNRSAQDRYDQTYNPTKSSVSEAAIQVIQLTILKYPPI